MFTDTQANIEIQSKLLDLKSKKLGVKRGGFDEANERYKVPDLGPVRRVEMVQDILPYVNKMIVPAEIRDVMADLFTPHEEIQFTQALNLMVYFDIRLLPPSATPNQVGVSSEEVSFDPNIVQLVTFGPGKTFIRSKLQSIIRQNYQIYKRKIKGNDVLKPSSDLLALMGNKKKRAEGGSFVYKFKEGHSKNFKQDIKFDYFTR
jgi:hypothetical protein